MRIYLILVDIVILSLFNSCCTKKYCGNAGDINELYFNNYLDHELDSIKVYSYARFSDYSEIVDSSFAEYDELGEENRARLSKTLNVEYNHRIHVISTGQIFTVSDFELEERVCNTCFPFRPDDDFYMVVRSFFLNGMKKNGSRIEITK
jgi:hypothetical protein